MQWIYSVRQNELWENISFLTYSRRFHCQVLSIFRAHKNGFLYIVTWVLSIKFNFIFFPKYINRDILSRQWVKQWETWWHETMVIWISYSLILSVFDLRLNLSIKDISHDKSSKSYFCCIAFIMLLGCNFNAGTIGF